MTQDLGLEMAFAMHIFNQADFYRVCNSHMWHNQHAESNEYPCSARFDISDFLPNTLPDDGKLFEKISRRFWDDLCDGDYFKTEFEKEHGFEIGFDINGYQLLAKIPIQSCLVEIERCKEEVDAQEDTDEPDDLDAAKEELADKQAEFIDYAKQLQFFLDWAPKWIDGWKRYYHEDCIVVIDDDDELDFVDRSWYHDMKEEYGWRKYIDEDNIIDERAHGNKTLEVYQNAA